MRRKVPPSAEIEKEIDALLAGELDAHPLEAVSELGRLGARLVLQRAVEEEVEAWLGRARCGRRPEAAPGLRNGYRPRLFKTGEGELAVEVPQARDAGSPFTSRLLRRRKRFLAAEPLQAPVVGAFLPGPRCATSSRSASRRAWGRSRRRRPPGSARSCGSASRPSGSATSPASGSSTFLGAIYLPVRPQGAREGVLCAWGTTDAGERLPLEVCLGMRESEEDWLERRRSRGLK